MDDRDCATCTRQEEWGCTAFKYKDDPNVDPSENWVRPAVMPVEINGELIFNCPRQHLYQNQYLWQKIFRYYGMYKKGHLPQAGAVCDQSGVAIDLFSLIDNINAECDQELNNREQKKRSRDQRAAQQRGRR